MSFPTASFSDLFDQALARREPLLAQLHAEKTDAYRLFHGIAEGATGLTVDRYGSLILAQTFREPLSVEECAAVEAVVRARLPGPVNFAYNHRGKRANETFDKWHEPSLDALTEIRCREFGIEFVIRPRHNGIDPWLFLDLRAGRRYVRDRIGNGSFLNLFSYTCTAGVTAAVAGSREVWNVDFAASNLDVGRRNAEVNGIDAGKFRNLQEDCLPVMRQLAGLPAGGRRNKFQQPTVFPARSFDFVFLDPPAWSKSFFGAVDVANDYQSLFKAAVMIAQPKGGRILATNHVASVELEGWINVLKRCADKAGRPLRSVETLTPEADFPSFDGKPPLKIAVCEV